jgi:hypothetical protein
MDRSIVARSEQMPKKVAICDHTIEHYVESMKDILDRRGHQVEHYYNRNPKANPK